LSDSLIEANKMRVIEIKGIKQESPTVKSIFFRDEYCSKANAGQFLMVWVPGIDEIPLSLSSIAASDELSSVTVSEVGEATVALNRRNTGDLIGIRGPFGNHFKIIGEKAIVVGGGIGIAPLMPLVEEAIKEHLSITVLSGARTHSELIFLDRLEKTFRNQTRVIATTNDGSFGTKGFVTGELGKVLASDKFDTVYACGPERMIRKVYSLTEKYGLPLQASLERIMRCAIGICGSCVIGKYRVCRDGPVFTTPQLREVEFELGRFKHGFTGKRIPI